MAEYSDSLKPFEEVDFLEVEYVNGRSKLVDDSKPKPQKKKSKKAKVDEVQVEEVELIEDDLIEDLGDLNIRDLMQEYRTLQEDGLEDSLVSDKYALKGMGNIKDLIVEAVMKIDEFTDNGKSDGLFSKVASKAVAVFDPNNNHLAKWFKKSKESARKVDIENLTPDQIISQVKNAIEAEKDSAAENVAELYKEKEAHLKRMEMYQVLVKKARAVYNNSEPDSEENFNAQNLVIMLEGSILKLKQNIDMDINPLITNTRLVVNDINMQLPTALIDLKAKLKIKGNQQQLSDLSNSMQIFVELANVVDEKVTTSIQQTTLETLESIKKGGINIQALQNKIKRDDSYKVELLKKIDDVRTTKAKEFKSITDLTQRAITSKTETEKFLENYSSSNNAIVEPNERI